MPKICKVSQVAIVAAIALVTVGCKGGPLRVYVPSRYSGPVTISCGSTSDEDYDAIIVGTTGQVKGANCPSRQVDVQITRDGKSISADGQIVWDTTGDGLLVGIHFKVP
jgi:hypothetical protein